MITILKYLSEVHIYLPMTTQLQTSLISVLAHKNPELFMTDEEKNHCIQLWDTTNSNKAREILKEILNSLPKYYPGWQYL